MSGETLFDGLLVRFARIRKHIAAPAVGVALTLAVASLVGCGSGSTQVKRPRTLHFSGYTWRVRSNPRTRLGPGPNYFSDSVSNVSVDSQGRLHLKLTHSHGRRYSASVISKDAFGYGRYTFELGSPVDALDPHVVLGLFTWSDNPAYHNREIDIEFSRFGDTADPTNGNFVVQPYIRREHLRRITQPAVSSSTHWFDWQSHSVVFGSSTATPSAWTYTGRDVPRPGSEHVRLNLWLFRGTPPANGKPVEIVVDRFRFSDNERGR